MKNSTQGMGMKMAGGSTMRMATGMDMNKNMGNNMDMNMGNNMDMNMGMSMTFHTGYAETILFPGVKTRNTAAPTKVDSSQNGGKFISRPTFRLINSVCEELRDPEREWLKRDKIIGACVIVFCVALLYEGLKVLREEIIEYYQKKKKCDEEPEPKTISIFIWPHILQTFLHIIQMVVSYFLMLIFMTYNVWLCLAVALGAGAGYFAFRWKRPFNALEASEHCH